jgi:Flp pilus assembly protein TadD
MQLAQAAMAAFARQDFQVAQELARALILSRPLDPNANQILGLIALERGDPATAKRHLERARQSAPNSPQIINSLGAALRRLGDVAGARAAFTRAGELGLIDGWRNLGNLEDIEYNPDASIAAYEHALRISPSDAAAHAALAQAFERRHDLARAKAHAAKALARDPANEIAHLALAQTLLREKDYAGAEEAALPVARAVRGSKTNQALAWGVIGEACDRRGDARAAFRAFTEANRLVLDQNRSFLTASHLLFHPDGIARMMRLAEDTNIRSWRPPATFETSAPVFLVGFPRSGTTLLDQILSSHSRIVCMEEKEHLANTLAGLLADGVKLAHYADLTDDELTQARADYWARVRNEIEPPQGTVVVDKLPLNIVILPLIKRVFPDAKIILALRDPRDVVLSCYQQRFGMNAAMAQFLELESAARYYDLIMSLLELCRERLELDLLQVRYEDVVADIETAAKRLAAFIGVSFEPEMIDFRATALKRDINTPSARQVVEPLYQRSIGKWRRYAADLAPILPRLKPWAERYGYDG